MDLFAEITLRLSLSRTAFDFPLLSEKKKRQAEEGLVEGCRWWKKCQKKGEEKQLTRIGISFLKGIIFFDAHTHMVGKKYRKNPVFNQNIFAPATLKSNWA